MKYSPHIYASAFNKALAETGEGDAGHLPKKLLDVISKNGDTAQISAIFSAIRDKVVRGRGGKVYRLEFATSRAAEKFGMTKFAGELDYVETAVRPELIAGLRATIDGEYELDNSFAGRLRKVFA